MIDMIFEKETSTSILILSILLILSKKYQAYPPRIRFDGFFGFFQGRMPALFVLEDVPAFESFVFQEPDGVGDRQFSLAWQDVTPAVFHRVGMRRLIDGVFQMHAGDGVAQRGISLPDRLGSDAGRMADVPEDPQPVAPHGIEHRATIVGGDPNTVRLEQPINLVRGVQTENRVHTALGDGNAFAAVHGRVAVPEHARSINLG